MLDWMHAPDVPRTWEGEWVLEWREIDPLIASLRFLKDYSRNPLHCGGIWFARVNLPIDRRLLSKRAEITMRLNSTQSAPNQSGEKM